MIEESWYSGLFDGKNNREKIAVRAFRWKNDRGKIAVRVFLRGKCWKKDSCSYF